MKRSRQSIELGDFDEDESDREFEGDHMPLSQTDNLAFESQPDYDSYLSTPNTLKFIEKEKRLFDRVHGQICLEPLLVRVMDTREFQRLRDLKQLGGSAFVFPDASHSRFEHSIGVAHLSKLLVQHLKRKQESKSDSCQGGLIDDRDVTCVTLAGLIHDLGHGPFSHMFEVFVNRSRKKRGEEKFEHEEMSVSIFKHLLLRNGIDMGRYMGTTEEEAQQDLEFVLMLIHGLRPGEPIPRNTGRPESKRFLFEIVSNQRNGIDVDKIDYFLRDESAAFGNNSPFIDAPRFIDACSVRELENGETAVVYEEKMAMDLLNLFRTRMQLHRTLYQHHVVNVVEEMITDALTAAAGVPLVRGSNGQEFDLLEATRDVEAYTNLGDWVLNFIEASTNPQLIRAQQIITRLRTRRLYEQVGMPVARRSDTVTEKYVVSQIISKCKEQGEAVEREDLLVHAVTINFGKNPQSGKPGFPLAGVYFFNPKDREARTFTVEESRISTLELPKSYEECSFWVYVRDPAVRKRVADAWDVVSKELFRGGKAADNVSMQNSPMKHSASSSSSTTTRRSLQMPTAMGTIEENVF